ncbi:DUF2953 domain-containing protein [Proteiniborus sp.]|uniref:DUF2953 domain-containing protein n=1 Tax=Proteiniborus sp. TaxID=2079015 RepID=UPI00331B18FF
MKFVLLLIFIILVIISIIPIYIKIELKRKNHDDIINVKISLFKRLINLEYKITYNDIVKTYKELEDKNMEKNLPKRKVIFILDEIIKKYKKVKKFKNTFSEVFKYILRKIDFSSFGWSSKIGLGDAALTGIAYGTVWVIVSTLINVITNYKDIKETSINIYPDFDENILEIDLFCIIKFKIVHIIIAGFKGIKVFIKGGVLNA